MSVLIKNMEIPEHCGYCRFRYDGICHALQKTQYSVEECPLVSVNDIKTAQPEIIMCKECKNHNFCAIEDEARDETFFCKWGERRE